MELRSSCQVAEWFLAAQKNVAKYELKTETDLLQSVSVSLQHQIAFFVLEKGYFSSISSQEMIHYFTFHYFVWKAIILFGYSFIHEMKQKTSRLSLMQADYHLSNAATSFGAISKAFELKDELDTILVKISHSLKNQKKRKSGIISSDVWERIEEKRFAPIQEFYVNTLRKFYGYSSQTDTERIYLFTFSIAFGGDLFYRYRETQNRYFTKILCTTPWEVIYVRTYNNGSEISLPVHSKKNERGDPKKHN